MHFITFNPIHVVGFVAGIFLLLHFLIIAEVLERHFVLFLHSHPFISNIILHDFLLGSVLSKENLGNIYQDFINILLYISTRFHMVKLILIL